MIDWQLDHAASGDRLRAFLSGGEIVVYFTGEWHIILKGEPSACATGEEGNIPAAQARALSVYRALVGSVDYSALRNADDT